MDTLIKVSFLILGFLNLLNLDQCFSNGTLVDHKINQGLCGWHFFFFNQME